MNRLVELLITAAAVVLASVPFALSAVAVACTSRGPVLYWSRRVGQGGQEFLMPKLRTMRIETPEVATHLLDSPDRWLTPIGRGLRRSSLDELPQLYCVIRGDMALVGPRPALHNQGDLILLRKNLGVDALRPGITGLAQVRGRDELSVPDKVAYDQEYLENRSLDLDLKLLLLTAFKVIRRSGVQH